MVFSNTSWYAAAVGCPGDTRTGFSIPAAETRTLTGLSSGGAVAHPANRAHATHPCRSLLPIGPPPGVWNRSEPCEPPGMPGAARRVKAKRRGQKAKGRRGSDQEQDQDQDRHPNPVWLFFGFVLILILLLILICFCP